MSDIDTVLERLVTDAEFRRLLAAEPARALHGYDLSAAERDMLLVRVSPDLMVGSTVEQRTSKAGMFALLGEAAALVGSHSDLVGPSSGDHGAVTPSGPGEAVGIIINERPTPGETDGIIIYDAPSPGETDGIIINEAPTPGEADGIIIGSAPTPGEADGIIIFGGHEDEPELKRQPEDSFGAATFRAGDLAGQVSGTPPIEPEFPVR